jgi:hypothetical protein
VQETLALDPRQQTNRFVELTGRLELVWRALLKVNPVTVVVVRASY